MAESAGNWCLIESDPGVFTELIKEFGVKGAQVEELWSLDDEQFENLKPIHGLIFLFKWVQDDEPSGNIVQDSRLEKIFFAKQVINNACATQAILSILLNCKHPDVSLGTTLEDLKNFCQSFDANMRGLALSNCDVIREVHNSFSRQTLFEYDSRQSSKDEDVFHFVGYLPIEGRLYELDGLKEGPVDLGPCPIGDQWVQAAKPIIQKRINKYNEGEIHFNLMALVSDRKLLYERQKMAVGPGNPAEIARLQSLIEEELGKSKRYQIENIRRKHNYLPLIMELLKLLAKEGKLVPLYQKAKERAIEKETKRTRDLDNQKRL
ncbi:ubiquitin carboxyl-terminal hydrolase isozyme L5 [Neodiprion pinetum]|uniref:ubiquitin carboxyl-terminal hydrolase isozyme L5 n=1 Tax=Neodiprion fabricii TaxID=2872261 RepID=UPI00076FDE6E|nr:ubiquitin carboxyl-terminal hydrolase isozyme L5 [Neodiprion fabricii]XP_046467739.1 ubiquitin carboxyl-terminal hydrolase isozyme L5 [Neodiprion pinetum]XP_046605678.1 ubiquitin carboxyl-terminal hydrolase isozyme L5 [Neodiprion virginianus]